MRAVFVNHCHPDTPHVCAVRVREFANAMAERGHRIMLLTATLTPEDRDIASDALASALRDHDWSRPFRLPCRPISAPLTLALQQHRLPAPVSKAMVLWCYLAKGGAFWNWTAASRKYWPVLAESFSPDVVWATFGNVDTLDIARGISAASGCPWVIDIKDPWDAFVPGSLAALVARRYADASALTALSEAHRDGAGLHFAKPVEVVYSGVAVDRLESAPRQRPDDRIFRLVLTGSTYDPGDLATLVAAIGDWLANLQPGAMSEAEFVYAGDDHVRVADATGGLRRHCILRILPRIDPVALAELQASASANLYVKGRTTPFHHKIIELLAAGRPIICHPAETSEAVRIAGAARVPFYSCAERPQLYAAFDAVAANTGRISLDRAVLGRYTWRAQSAVLERVLADAAAKNGKEGSCVAIDSVPSSPRHSPADTAWHDNA